MKTKTVAELARRWLGSREGPTETEIRILQSAIDRRAISRDVNALREGGLSTGDRIADAIARIGGSWAFILSFIAFLIAWTVGGTLFLGGRSFDPYPFIFLNLVLSMIAALQAPVIMMSQNRQSEHDRVDAAHDYEVNLKAEIEIMALHEKFDDLRHQDILRISDQIAELQKVIVRLEGKVAQARPSS